MLVVSVGAPEGIVLGLLDAHGYGSASCGILMVLELSGSTAGSSSTSCSLDVAGIILLSGSTSGTSIASCSLSDVVDLVPSRLEGLIIEFDRDLITTFGDDQLMEFGTVISVASCSLLLGEDFVALVPSRHPALVLEFDRDIMTTFGDDAVMEFEETISVASCDLTVTP